MKRTIPATVVFSLLLALCCLLPATAENKAPDQIPGKVVYIAYPVTITPDGNLDDWAGIPVQKVDTANPKSPDPKQNQYFDFAVCADTANLYVYMHSQDAKIITGQHAANFWNEDSMEFYVNLSGDLKSATYKTGIAQFNINPASPASKKLTITGTNGDTMKVTGKVFKTADGWAFEAAVPLGKVVPEHGKTIGFQVQANGASGADRNSQIVWSVLDKTNESYKNPSLFGKGVFFKIGSTDVPAAAN